MSFYAAAGFLCSPDPPIQSGPAPTPRSAPASAGSIRIRVRYCECDPMNVAHHASYIPWLEMGRTELLRDSGVSYADLERAGVFLVVTRLEIKYRRPVLYDDLVELRTRWTGGSRIKIEHDYELFIAQRAAQPQDLSSALPVALASTTLACVGRDGRPQPLPDWLVPSA